MTMPVKSPLGFEQYNLINYIFHSILKDTQYAQNHCFPIFSFQPHC